MAPWKALLLLGLVACAAVAGVSASEEEAPSEGGAVEDDDYQEAERAFLVVRKYFQAGKDEWGVQGRNLTVTIEVHNAGTNTAKEVTLEDAALPEGFSLHEGGLTATLGQIDAGSSVKHAYTIVPTQGSFGLRFDPATVTYVAEIDSSEKQTVRSSSPGIYVQTPIEQIRYYMLVAGKYATLGMVQSYVQWRNLAILSFVAFVLLGGNSAASSLKASRVERNRARALRELEKSE